MCNIIFVGDVHLKGSSPISRKDDYPEVILNKLLYIADCAEELDCKYIFFLGDIFDTVNTSIQYFSHALGVFKSIRDKGIELYTIVGNHDIRYNSMDSFPYTPLGILVNSGIMKLLDEIIIDDDIYIKGFHYPNEITPNRHDDLYSIVLLHRFYESGFNEVPVTREDVINLGYDSYILGHDHRPYITQDIYDDGRNIKVIRTGSVARNSSDQYNRMRKPRFLIFDTESKEYTYQEVQSENGIDVFFEQQIEAPMVSMKELVDYLQSSYHTSNNSIRDYLNGAVIPDDVKSLIDSYLNILGA